MSESFSHILFEFYYLYKTIHFATFLIGIRRTPNVEIMLMLIKIKSNHTKTIIPKQSFSVSAGPNHGSEGKATSENARTSSPGTPSDGRFADGFRCSHNKRFATATLLRNEFSAERSAPRLWRHGTASTATTNATTHAISFTAPDGIRSSASTAP